MVVDVLLVLAALWLVFNWLAPFSLLLLRSECMSAGRVPSALMQEARRVGAHLYTARLDKPGGFSVLAWPWKLIVFDRDTLSLTPAWAWRFLIAHEIGHCALGHLYVRWFLTVTGLILLPCAGWWLNEMEREADVYAERLTGLKAGSFYNRRSTHEDVA